LENLKGRYYLGDRGAGKRTIIEVILRKQGVKMWIGFKSNKIGSSI
jgi:hypothetical protein